MTKRIGLLLLLLIAGVMLFSLPVNSLTRDRVAQNFVTERLGTEYTIGQAHALDSGFGQAYIYVYNLSPRGFILITADDAATPIVGYSDLHNWGETELPEQLAYMLSNWNAQMHAIVTRGMLSTTDIRSEWNRLSVEPAAFSPSRDYRDISPLLSSVWGQGTYYNALCPTNTPVGCVATAMAQIMKYWSFPVTGTGTHSYTHPVYGTQSADFGATTYNWSAMPNNVTSANTAVATISYHAGVAVNMDYDPSGSGAYSTDVPAALTTYFRYASTAHYYDKSAYSSTVWENMMKGELDNSRPVYYSGSSAASGGHAFVLDGYSGSNFHVNWGWNGSYNGYFALTALNPGGENFTSNQAAVIGIRPTATTPSISEGFEGTTFPPTGWTATASTWARSATNFITGAYSARYNVTATGATASGKQLITKRLVVDATTPDLTFKARAGTTLRAEQIKIGYSTSASGPWTYLANAVLSTSVQTFTRTINTLTPGNYYFVFETYSTNSTSNSKTWIIDDIAGPYMPTTASLNLTSWAAGDMAPGDQASSGNIFTLSNTGSGTLTITSVTNLSSSEFKSNFNSAISLVYGQSHDFGFTYDPLNYGSDSVNYQIVTNVGTLTIALSGSASYAIFADGFENYTDFSLSFAPWTQYDGDASATYGVSGATYTNSGYTGSYIIFNPNSTSPAVSGAEAHIGQKYAACFAATTPPNNDWLISPQFTMAAAGSLKFWAKSYTADYGLERFKVLYSTTTNTYTAFTNYLAGSATTYVEAPTTWTQYTYTLPVTAKYFAIQCVSNDAFFLLIDDVAVSDGTTPPAPTFGNLSGHVYAYGTATPISNALITVGTKTTYTDANGFYQINNLIVGTHTAICTAPGMFYFSSTVSGIAISNGNTTTQDFGLTWGELTANPTSLSINLYQGETTNQSITLSNPGGTANTTYAGYIGAGTAPARGAQRSLLGQNHRKPSPDMHGVRIDRIQATSPERYDGWFGYAAIGDADYFTAATTERGTYFIVDDIALMDGAVTITQLRHYFYNPSTAAWTSTTNKFNWKIYTVSPTGTVTLVHTSAQITLATTTPTNTYLLSSYTLPTAVSIPAGYDFIVSVAPTSTTTGKPQSLATSVYTSNGLAYDSTNGWSDLGMDLIMDAYVTGTSWLDGSSFSGTITPAGSVSIPLNFNTVGVSAGAKYANMYIYNNSNYVAPSAGNRGDVMVVPITLNVTVATTPVAVLTGTNWTTNANVGTPSTSGDVFTLKNVGPGNLTITSFSGLSGTPFTSNINTGISLPQNGTHSFGFTFNPTTSGIYTATVTIVTNGGTKTITLKGYANYVSETFEGATFPPDGWQIVDNDADTYNWMAYTATDAAHAGAQCAGSASYVNDAAKREQANSSKLVLYPDNWLITPKLTIASGDVLSYWIAAQDASWAAEHYSVKISTTTNAVSAFTTTLFSETLSDATWRNKEIDLSAYAGQNVYLAFQHHSCSDQFVLKLDDVLMPPLAAPLVYGSVSGRISKAGTTDYVAGAVVTVSGHSFTTLEDGGYTISDLVVDTYEMTVTATGYISYAANVTIPANSTLTHNVALDYAEVSIPTTTYNTTVNVGQTTTIPVTMSNTGTAALTFDTASGVWGGDIHPAGALNQTWETGDLTGWSGSVTANSDIYGSAAQPYGYLSDATWVFASNGATAVQYLISPKLRVVSGDNLAFWYKQFNSSTESFEVRISTTDTNIASFTTLATIGPLADTNWANFSQALDAYAGQDIYVCFYYPRVDSYQYGYVMIDTITGPTQIVAPTGWLSCTPLSGTVGIGGSQPLTLSIDATTLPVGNYTAQTWIFSNGLVSPYKLYVNLTVQNQVAPSTPTNVLADPIPGGIALAWDEMDYANSYKIYASPTPDGTYTLVGTATGGYAEFTEAELAPYGITNCAFFKVSSDTASRSLGNTLALSRATTPLMSRIPSPGSHKLLHPTK